MFVRQKQNKSGSVSIQIVDKSSGKYKVLRTIGSSKNLNVISQLLSKAQDEIDGIKGQEKINFNHNIEKDLVDTFFNGIEDISLTGPELLLGKIFDEIGFNKLKDDFFRHLVITRLVYPVSKLKTVDYLSKYKGITIKIDKLYRYLDKLHQEQMLLVQEISYKHSVSIVGSKLSVIFYDVTTLYFESEDEDDLRKIGFSKDGKHQHPQIVLGLLVNQMGFPLEYAIFEGNKYEGHTMMPVLAKFREKYKLERIVVVADSGLMSNQNIRELKENNYQYIIGARIKNESEEIKSQVLKLDLKDGESAIIKKQSIDRLIVGYSLQRAKKDSYNRKRGIEKLEKLISTGQLTKKHINNKGYNKYLILKGEINIAIDYEKYKMDSKWDGLKGYFTNTNLSKEEVIEQYTQLWNIEKTFRISKTDLRIRPIFHYLKRRIESHICISFAACVVYKELERQLKYKKSLLSPEKVIEILKTIYSITIKTPYSSEKHSRLIIKTDEQRDLLKLFQVGMGCPNA